MGNSFFVEISDVWF